MSLPRWLTLGPAEVAEVRATPGMEMLIEWLEWERERSRELVLAAAATGGDTKLRAGASVTFDHILRSLKTPMAVADLPDEEFIDPAKRPSRTKGT